MKSAGIVTLLLAASTHHLPTVCGLTTLPPSRGVSSSVRPSSPMQSRRLALASLSTAALALLTPTSSALAEDGGAKQRRKLQRYPSIRFISALGDPTASSGDSGAESWGLWRDDPGPRGVYLRDYDRRIGSNDDLAAPAGWKFDPSDWWVEEHGLIMSTPEPLPRKSLDRETRAIVPEKKYVVTGDREVTTVLTVRENGSWELERGTLYDVTHLPCRSAAYRGEGCAPKNANLRDFPVKPGAAMPAIDGCEKQDYAVLFVLGEVV
eukprot:CAMPEP_0196143000 /NCGR_PEP_ID=MMETSP0910-20130528/12559_1 /TAXON_ID=49265 /ORGANISM="Thalassiosira rotula, Strain GSO102" /LENGTH=264 /DNA_ID=CAMNT_0041404385 /DNA_START=35 /DNA_END=829 /DNA_ORIENTATION=-